VLVVTAVLWAVDDSRRWGLAVEAFADEDAGGHHPRQRHAQQGGPHDSVCGRGDLDLAPVTLSPCPARPGFLFAMGRKGCWRSLALREGELRTMTR